MDVHQTLAVGIALLTILGLIARPWGTPEWAWAVAGGVAECAAGAVGPPMAWSAILGGADVYAFLIGVLILAEAARSQGVFAWLAGRADAVSGGSRFRLLAVVYCAGVVVTATLSNDTAIIVLTPAALALGRRIGGSVLPYLFACAFVANAASFLLPSGNPANLLLYGRGLPPLAAWLATYGPAGAMATIVTFALLVWTSRAALAEPVADQFERPRSTASSRIALWLLACSAGALVAASAFGLPLGPTALVCGIATTGVLWIVDRNVVGAVARGTAWGVVPLVAGLLVVVAALERAGATVFARTALTAATALPLRLGREVVGFVTMLLANGANNLPVAVFAGRALADSAQHPIAHAVLIGIDLGPNLSVSGSLATLLWLIVLRREGVTMTPLQFFFRGLVVTLPAMLAALLVVR